MYSEWSVFAGGTVLAVFVWLSVVSFLIWKQHQFLKSLFPKSGERDIRKKFEEVLKQVFEFKQDLKGLEEKLLQLEDQGLSHIQRVELLRYNPYEDTGGNISFSLALLDKEGDGVILTSLHARSGTRMFVKSIKDGKSQNIKLSKEEEYVLEKALEGSKKYD